MWVSLLFFPESRNALDCLYNFLDTGTMVFLLAILFGLVVGSFLNVIDRIPWENFI